MEYPLNRRIVLRCAFAFLCQLAALSGLVGCGEEELTHPSVLDGEDDSGPGTVTQDYFSVTLVNGGRFEYVLSQKDNFSSSCQIVNGDSNQDITCILDINEGDLYFHRLKFRANTPAYMCKYVSVANYFFNNYEIGYVDYRRIEITKTVVASNITGCDCDLLDENGNSLWTGTCAAYNDLVSNNSLINNNGELKVDTATCGAPTCLYDYSQTDSSLPNCCLGGIDVKVDTVTDGVPAAGQWASVDYNASSDLAGCFGGPARHSSWPKVLPWNIPSDIIYDAYLSGINVDLEVTPNIKTPGDGDKNVYAANYYTGAPASLASLPAIPEAVSRAGGDRNGTVIGGYNANGTTYGVAGNDAYEWRCLDEAHEVKNRIRLYVREWNTYAEWKDFKEKSGTSGDPSYPGLGRANRGNESSGCESGYTINHGYCNDYLGWDDITADANPALPAPQSPFPEEMYESSWPAYDTALDWGD